MADVLGRGWSPTERQYRFIRLGLALLLIASPALVYVIGYGQPTYRYDAVRVEADDDRITYDDDRVRFFGGFRGIGCYLKSEESRECFLDRTLVDGNATFPDESYRPESDARYTYVDDRFYERVGAVRNDSIVMSLRPVTPDAVLENVSVSYADLPRPLRRAVSTDEGTAHRDLEAHGQIVRPGDDYYAIYETESSKLKGYVPAALAVPVGLWLLLRSVRVEMRK